MSMASCPQGDETREAKSHGFKGYMAGSWGRLGADVFKNIGVIWARSLMCGTHTHTHTHLHGKLSSLFDPREREKERKWIVDRFLFLSLSLSLLPLEIAMPQMDLYGILPPARPPTRYAGFHQSLSLSLIVWFML